MGLESIYKLSVILNMVDNLTSPLAGVTSSVDGSIGKIQQMEAGFGEMVKVGSTMATLGMGITAAVLAPVAATFETRKAIGELASLGVEDLQAIEDAARNFSDTWAGTSKADFITAAYDIKSGIASLSDEGIAQYTEVAGLTAKATKSTVGEMTDLFATGYGIYKDFYGDLSDLEFAEIFSAGISESVRAFKTSGSGMANAIKTLGASATTAQVPLEEQLAILGSLQATMSGSEAGTKYKAFLRSAVKGGENLGLSFTDANNQLLSMPEILEVLRGKFGDTIDAAEKMELQKAFGDTEAVALIDLMYNKSDALQGSIVSLYGEMEKGTGVAHQMASAINETEPDKMQRLKQQIQNTFESMGNTLLPTINEGLEIAGEALTKVGNWIEQNENLVRIIMLVALAIGTFLTVAGTAIAVIGGVGLVMTKMIGIGKGVFSTLKLVKGGLETVYLKGLYAGDGIKVAFGTLKTTAGTAVSAVKRVSSSVLTLAKNMVVNGAMAVKNFVLGMVGMAKQAIVTAVTALPGLIAGVWSFTAALLANPVTWIVIGIVALIAALILLWKNWDEVTAFIKDVWNSFIEGIVNGFNWIREKIASLPEGFKILLAVIAPFISIPLLIIENWDMIKEFFSTLWGKVTEIFTGGIDGIKEFISGVPEWFRESGKKIIETFTEGIKSAIELPFEAVKGGLAKVRNLLPFSDAKEGPLSTLTLSGRRVLETITTGIHQSEGLPAEAVEDSFQQIDLTATRKPIQKISLQESFSSSEKQEKEDSSKEKNIIIQKLTMSVDISKIKDLNNFLKLMREVEDYVNANGGTEGDVELELA